MSYHLSFLSFQPAFFKALLAMDVSWQVTYDRMHNKGGKPQGAQKQYQAVGEYCSGEHIEKCKKQYGIGLARVCATCPD